MAAEESFELFSITNKLTLDTAQFDRAYGDSRNKLKTLGGEMNKLENSTKSGAGGFSKYGGALDMLSPKLGSLAMGGPMGLAVAGVTALTSVIGGAAAGVWALTKNFSDAASELDDLSQQVNFSTSTLGTFSAAGKMVGVDVDSLSSSFTKFQKNLAEGNEIFKVLGVTSKDNEVALRQAMKAISEITDKTLQSAAAQEVFGKSGKAMLAIIKATGGDLDASSAQLRKWNVLLSDEAIAIGDEFGDKLSEMQLRLQGIGNTIGTETAPAFTAGFIAISAALDANMVAWDEWGEFIAKVILSATVALGGYMNMVRNASWKNLIPGYGAYKAGNDFFEGMEKTADLVVPEYAKRKATLSPNVGVDIGGEAFRKKSPYEQALAELLKKSDGGGRGRAGAREQEDPIIRMMERYQDQLRNLTPMTVEQQIRQELLGKEYANSSAELKAMLIVTGMTIDVKKKEIEATKAATAEQERGETAYKAFAQQQFETLRQINQGQMTAYDAARVAMLDFMDVTTPMQRWWVLFNGLLIDAAGTAERLARALNDIGNIGPAEIKFPEPTGEYPGPNMPPPPQMEESMMLKWRRLIDDFAYDIAHTVDRAIQRGFEDGVKAGIGEFGLGLLEMARHEALNELARAMRRALGGGEEGEEGGGGWLSKLIGFGVNALAGLFGGGASIGGAGSASAGAIGGKAGGGFMFPNEWSWVGERGPELVKAGSRGASVISNSEAMSMSGMAGMTVVQNINVPNMYAAGNRQTQQQALRGLTQAAHRGYSLRG